MTSPDYRNTLARTLVPQWRRVSLLAALLLGSIGLQLLAPLILRHFVDAALAGALTSVLTAAALAYLAAGVLNQLLAAGASVLGADVGWTATNRLRDELASHLLRLDMAFHAGTTPGALIERIDGDVDAVAQFLARFVVQLLGSGLLLAGVIVVSWTLDGWLGLALTLYVVAVLGLLMRLRRYAVRASEQEREVSAQLYGFVEERLTGLDDLRANGAGRFTMWRFADVLRRAYEGLTRASRQRAVLWVSANTAFFVGDAIALALGAGLCLRGTISVGTAVLVVQYVSLVRTPVEQVARQVQELQKAAGGIVRIDALLATRSALDESGTLALPRGPLAVALEQVDFAYESAPVLEGIDLALAPGTVLGLLGRTGAGKTTLTRLLCRLIDPDHGTVSLGGVALRDVAPAQLRRAVGVVTQDVQLFGASTRDNLTFFDRARSDDELLAVLDGAGLGDWVRGLGLDTPLGAGGVGLSAGEAQLLAFARVFLQDPGLVLLDEPASRLDPATEALVAGAARRLFAGRTVVIVAHRLETVRAVDEICVLDAGRVVEHGPRATLAADPDSRYARLLATGAGDLLDGGR